MRALRILVVRLAPALMLAAAVAAPAQASCAMPPPLGEAIRDADVAFVGTVTRVANQDRWATVTVEELWRGPDLPAVVEVRAGPPGNTASSVDRTYAAGTRYLFTVTAGDGALNDSSCSSTTEWTADLAEFRPADARPPVTSLAELPSTDADSPSLILPLAAVAAVGLVVFGAVAFVAGRRRSPA